MPTKEYTPEELQKLTSGSTDTADGDGASSSSNAQPDNRNGLQRVFDESTAPLAAEDRKGLPNWLNETQDASTGFINGLGSLAVHPWESVKGVANAFVHPMDTATAAGKAFDEHPGYTIGQTIGGAFGTLGAGEGIMRGVGAAKNLPNLREAARGNPDEAALRALRIPQGSTDATRTLSAVEGARPFLKGTKSIADAQERIPAAKAEIWAPYEDALNKVGDRPVRGPDGMTTIRELEAERLQLSAMNRGLKTGDPASLQLAEQKGLSQAQALARQAKVQTFLDRELKDAGINPQGIRKAFGQVSEVGSHVLGRSTLTEKTPSGLGRMANVEISRPRTWIGEPLQGARDIVAGRPWWTARPSDVSFGEAFRTAGPKPVFGVARPLPRWQLPENATVREGEEPFGEWQFGVPRNATVTPQPRVFAQLPAESGAGEAEPMVWPRAPQHPGVAEGFQRTRISPTVFAEPEVLPPQSRIAGPEGIRIAPRGMLTGKRSPFVEPRGGGQ